MKPEVLEQRLHELVKSRYKMSVDVRVVEADPQFGDYSSNLAFGLAGRLHRAPAEIAQELADALNDPAIAGVSAVNGYLNITFHDDYWLQQLAEIDHNYGQTKLGRGQKVQIEFISANPTGPLTLGNGRGGYWGDILANVLDRTGYEVSREYYINDAGNQVQVLKDSIWFKVSEKLSLVNHKTEPGYLGEYVEDIADDVIELIKKHLPSEKISKLSYPDVIKYIDKYDALSHILNWIKASVKAMGIDFDVWFSEASLHASGAVDQVMEQLKSAQATYERDGAVWLNLGGPDKDRVLVKADGSYTYLTPDLAYHYDKFARRGFDKVINLWGADHGAQVNSLVKGVEKLGLKGQLDIILFQIARLIRGGQEVKVSKRSGVYVTMDELLEQIAPDVARFFFVMRSNNTQMDFDLDLAKEESQKNPYHYVMYAYVRAQAILAKAAAQDLKPAPLKDLAGVEKQLVKQMTGFPPLLEQIAGDYAVHRLTFFGMELAKLFHEYYETVPVLGDKAVRPAERLSFIKHFAQFMQVYFEVLGITPVSKM